MPPFSSEREGQKMGVPLDLNWCRCLGSDFVPIWDPLLWHNHTQRIFFTSPCWIMLDCWRLGLSIPFVETANKCYKAYIYQNQYPFHQYLNPPMCQLLIGHCKQFLIVTDYHIQIPPTGYKGRLWHLNSKLEYNWGYFEGMLQLIGRLQIPVRKTFSFGIQHVFFAIQWTVIVQWITMKICHIPYENVCRTGVCNLFIMTEVHACSYPCGDPNRSSLCGTAALSVHTTK